MSGRGVGLGTIVVAALAGAFLAGDCRGGGEARAERERWAAKLAVEAESTAAWRIRAAAAAAEAQRLREDSARVYPAWGLAREAADAGLAAVRELARSRLAAGDTAGARVVEAAANAADAERAACSVVVVNCEARAATAETARADAAGRVDSLAAVLDTTGIKLQAAERRASSGFLGLRDLWRAKEELGAVVLLLLGLTVVK